MNVTYFSDGYYKTSLNSSMDCSQMYKFLQHNKYSTYVREFSQLDSWLYMNKDHYEAYEDIQQP